MKPDPQLRVFICASRPKKRWSVDRLVVEIVKLDSTGSNTDLKIDGLAEKLTLLGRYTRTPSKVDLRLRPPGFASDHRIEMLSAVGPL